jgi:CBS domain-containing protein
MDQVARDIMSNQIVSIEPERSLFDAYQLMKTYDIRHLPVIDNKNKKLVGLLSEGDIVLYCREENKKLAVDSDMYVKDAMTKDVIFCYPTSSAANIAATMITAKIDSIPVLDSQTNKLLGIITTTDLLDLICMSEELDGHDVHPFKLKKTLSRREWGLKKSI